jgi:hypothetical protein
VLTIAGLLAAIVQSTRAQTAAVAARSAADGVASRFADLLLTGVLPQLALAEADVRYARDRGDHDLAVRAVQRWRRLVTEARGLLVARGALRDTDTIVLHACATLSNEAENALHERTGTVHEAVAELLREMEKLASRLSEISARILTEVPRGRI